MRDSTIKLIRVALEADETIAATERDAIQNAIINHSWAPIEKTTIDRVLKRKEVAALFGKTTQWVDWQARQPHTLLERVCLGGARSCGYSESSVRAALSSRKTTTKANA